MEWKISRGQQQCTICAAAFEENQIYFSALLDTGLEFLRKDYCPTCWESKKESVFSFWKTRVPPKEGPSRPMVDNEVLMDFFQRLEPEQAPSKMNFRYLLSLMLMRKKLLKFEDIERDQDREYLILRQPGEAVRHRVLDPKLSRDQLEQLREDLGRILYLED